MPILTTTDEVHSATGDGRAASVTRHDGLTYVTYDGLLVLNHHLVISPGQLQRAWIASARTHADQIDQAAAEKDGPRHLRLRAQQFVWATAAVQISMSAPWSQLTGYGRTAVLRDRVLMLMKNREAFYRRARASAADAAQSAALGRAADLMEMMIRDVDTAAGFDWLLDEDRLLDVGDDIRRIADAPAPVAMTEDW